jgi:hypothetical protein
VEARYSAAWLLNAGVEQPAAGLFNEGNQLQIV